MKRKIIAAVLMAVLACVAFVGCGNSNTTSSTTPVEPLDLTGNWEEKDKGESYQAGYIKDGEIVIYWVSDGGDTKSLYWAGSYEAPMDNTEPYTWDSVNDKEQTGLALLASGDDTKTFTYENGELTYSASALGTTKKMHFVRTDTDYSN